MIPKVVHFVWLYWDGGKEWNKSFEYGILSVLNNTTMKPVLHTNADIHIEGVETRNLENAYDNKLFTCPAHKADVIRLDILYKHGGIYSDLDVIWLRNPTEYFNKKVAIGYTNKSYKILCNAVMLSEAGNQALLTYKDWLLSIMPCKKYWIPANPYKLWKDNADVVMIDRKEFFPIRYQDVSKEWSFDDVKNSICVHLFCSMNDIETIYNKVFKPVFE